MNNKAVFLDRDGTINIDKGYVYKKEDFELLDGVLDGLKMLQSLGFRLIVISNQSGIARKLYTEKDANIIFNYMVDYLKNFNIIIDKYYYCPHLNEKCNCRKPKLGLFYKAQKEFNINLKSSYAIGDKLRDLSICNIEQVHGFLITEGNKPTPKNITNCSSLLSAARTIREIEGKLYGNNNTL